MTAELASTDTEGDKAALHEKVRQPSRELWVATVGLVAATIFHLQSQYISFQAAAGTYLGLLGPFATLLLSSYLHTTSRLALLQNYVNVAIFAATSAAIVSVYLPFVPLIGLNITGALLDGIFLILNKVAEKDGAKQYEVTILETFRGTFFGVWTSFTGMVIEFISLTSEQSQVIGVIYLFSSMVLSAFAHEAGLRIGGWLEESQHVDAESMMKLSNWLPYCCSYVACSSFFSFGNIPLLLSYIMSALGCYWAGAVDDGNSIMGPFLTNSIATIMALSVVFQCERNRFECGRMQPFKDEFIGSFCGAGSAFTSSAQIVHDLFVSWLPEEIIEDRYYGPYIVGSICLQQYNRVDYGSNRSKRTVLATRAIADFSIGLFSISLMTILR